MVKKYEIAKIDKPFTEEVQSTIFIKLGAYTKKGELKKYFIR